MAKQKIVLIGGFGFIGSSLVKYIDPNRFNLSIIGRQNLKESDKYQSIDYRSERADDEINSAEIVIDLSYSSTPQTSFDSPDRDIIGNLPRTVKLLSSLSESKYLRKLIMVSSGGTVYGNQDILPITETAEMNPISPYGITKLAIEKYALMFQTLNHLPVIILRPSNAFGPGQIPYRNQGFISTAIASIIKGRELCIYGESGTVRDYLYVDDLANAIIKTMNSQIRTGIYNVASSQGMSNLEVIEFLKSITGVQPIIKHLPERPFDVKANVLSIDKIRNEIGWSPKTTFEEGLKNTIDWVDRFIQS